MTYPRREGVSMSGVAAEEKPHSLPWLRPRRSDCPLAVAWQHLAGHRPSTSYRCGLGYGPLVAGSHSHPQVSGVLQPTRCQDSLPGGVVGVGAGGIGAQLDPIAAHAIVVVHNSASDWARDHPGDSNSDRSDD
jgi:hypothetical protein